MFKHSFVLALLLLLLPIPPVLAVDSFIFCIEDQDFPPFLIGSTTPSVGEGGLLPELVAIAADEAELSVGFITKPWKRCQVEVKEGISDGLFAFIYSDERDTWAAFPKQAGAPDDRFAFQSDYVIFTRQGSDVSWDGRKLAPRTAVVQSVPGYIADQLLQAMGFMPMMNLQPDKAFELIVQGRLDGYIVADVLGWRLAEKLGLANELSALPIPFMSQQWYVAFSKQAYAAHGNDIEAFWTALKKARIQHSAILLEKYK